MLIYKYQTTWPQDFNKIKTILNETLLNLMVSIEHVGSTSVPHLAAKPIIDIDIIYTANTAFEEIKTGLDKIGYYHNGNQGIQNREVFKRNLMAPKHIVLDFISHHLYVCPANSAELEKHILFRDYLRSNEETRLQYAKLKYELAAEAKQDKKKYAQLKEDKAGDFINAIIANAKRGKTTIVNKG